jgi:hypothetical protein
LEISVTESLRRLQNALIYWRDKPDWNQLKTTAGVRLYTWDEYDPLADVLLMQFGGYPDPAETHIDYLRLVREASGAVDCALASNAAIPGDVFDYSTISHLSRAGLRPHYGISSAWKHEGFYLGDSGNHEDLINCWNLRAANVPLLFVDAKHLGRYEHILPSWKKMVSESLASRRSDDLNSPAVWARDEVINDHAAHSANVCKMHDHPAELEASLGVRLRCPLLLRIVRCLPGELISPGAAALEGQALDNPQGRKPRECTDEGQQRRGAMAI